MTHAFIGDLEDRKRHVRHYLLSVASVERATQLGSSDRIQEGRLLTLRAGTFLILYNLIEASVRGAIEAIHDTITTRGVEFKHLKVPLRKMIVALFKKEADPSVNHSMDDLPTEFVAIALALGRGFKLSGSVVSKAIRELGDKYGFSCTVSPPTRGGSDLLVIKRNRNDLAHGLKTFEEVGRDYPIGNLIILSRRTMQYMSEITGNIAVFIDEEGYKV